MIESKLHLFTLLAEFKGGTYVRQVDADSALGAVHIWRDEELGRVAKLSGTALTRLRSAFQDEAVAMNECVNVWCLTFTVGRELLLMNIVATAKRGIRKD